MSIRSFFTFFVLSLSFSAVAGPDELVKSFVKSHFPSHNLPSYKRDKILSGVKYGSEVDFKLEAYAGPGRFKQIAVWCDQCKGGGFSDEQVRICNENVMSFHSHLFPGTRRSFAEDLRRARGDGPIFLKSESGFNIRLSSGALKCDGQGPGSRLRLDFFPRK